MATAVTTELDSPISSLLNTTLTIHKSTPVVGMLLASDTSTCHKYLASLRRRILPFLELLPNASVTGTTGAWSTQQSHSLLEDGCGVTIHSITLPSCKFILLVPLHTRTEHERQLVIFSRAQRQLHNVFINWLEMYFDIVVRPLKLSTDFLLRFIEDYVLSCHRNQETTAVQLDFTTGIPQVRRITMAFEADDVMKFARSGQGVMSRMMQHMENSTGLKFQEIDISRAACSGGVIGADGRIKYIVGADVSDWRTGLVETSVGAIADLVWRT
ncbi:kinetochore complex Sim4 subunit Fta1-domain-containing protein [Lipomyces doorenjongii]|uniref:kinetochore complex Sim4 subunit Fta1-domain-containing protein n=1 Tax=Lipomyces doorenjongii TaxID=383834 RepID=UPI0034CE94F6